MDSVAHRNDFHRRKNNRRKINTRKKVNAEEAFTKKEKKFFFKMST